MGRRKIEMKLVKESNSRQVTFSKRRNGVFKKANELATLCAIQIAIIVFSPGGKAFSFGHSSVESVTDRYLHDQKKPVKANAELSSKTSCSRVRGGQQSEKAARLSWKLNELQNELNEEKEFGEILKERISINDLDYEQLVEMKQKLEELKSEIELRKTELEVCDALLLLSERVVKLEI